MNFGVAGFHFSLFLKRQIYSFKCIHQKILCKRCTLFLGGKINFDMFLTSSRSSKLTFYLLYLCQTGVVILVRLQDQTFPLSINAFCQHSFPAWGTSRRCADSIHFCQYTVSLLEEGLLTKHCTCRQILELTLKKFLSLQRDVSSACRHFCCSSGFTLGTASLPEIKVTITELCSWTDD